MALTPREPAGGPPRNGRFPAAPGLAHVWEAAMMAIQPCRTLAERVTLAMVVADRVGPDRPDLPDLSPGPWTRWVATLARCDVADVPRAVREMRLSQRIRARYCTAADVGRWTAGAT